MMSTRMAVAALGLVGLASATNGADVFDLGPGLTSIEFVTVGEPGNAADPRNTDFVPGIGSVSETFRMGKFEVTNAQYAAFLNAAAASDPFGLFNPAMANENPGGIVRSGSPGSFTYAVKPGRENSPVNFVGYFDALRFVNWLSNGQGSGDTESGVYELDGPTTLVSGRAPGAAFFLPSEDEWYKAAYYQPADQGGDVDDYWLYATRSNTIADNMAPNGANYFDGDFVGTGTTAYPFTVDPFAPVGSYTEGASFFGTFDQNGNVAEWCDTTFFGGPGGRRVLRGGGFDFPEGPLQSDGRASALPTIEILAIGFRVAAAAEPVEPACPGDVNGDLAVDGADLLAVVNAFGSSVSGGASAGDVDGNGVVDGGDLLGVVNAFGSVCG